MLQRPLHPHLVASDPFSGLDVDLLAPLEPELELVRLAAGEVLVRQGEVGDAMYLLVEGELEVRVVIAAGTDVTVDRLAPGASVGEMALVAGQARSATVRAARASELVRLSRSGFERIEREHPEIRDAVLRQMAPRLQRVQLSGLLERWFDALDPQELHALQEAVAWVALHAGDPLFREGERGDGMYLLVSGRLRLSRRRDDGGERTVGEVGRGESVGEYAVFGDAPRAESAVALRDSLLVKLDRELVAGRAGVMAQIARTALERGRGEARARGRGGVHTVALVPSGEGDPVAAVAERLAAQLGRWGRVLAVDASAVDRAFGRDGVAQTPHGAPSEPSLAHWLDERERACDALLLHADPAATPWTRRCLRQADVVLVVASASSRPIPGAVEAEARASGADVQLLLVHPDGTERPEGSARWLEPRAPLSSGRLHHLRLGSEPDAARLARRLGGRAVGLVLSGGGARGYTHIGLIRALEERGVAVDFVAGTSMGALVGGGYALSQSYAFCHDTAAAFGDPRKVLDRTLPMVALNESRAVTRVYRHLFGDARIEDLWLPFFCVSANLTRAEPVVHDTGPLWEAVRASSAIPGVFTPVVWRGDVLVDGGVMNNFPVDLMRERVGAGVVIGSNAYTQSAQSHVYDFGTSVSGWKVLLQKLLPRARRTRYPSMIGTLMRATSLSSKHIGEAAGAYTDLLIRYPTQAFGNLDFGHYDELIEIGYREAGTALDAWLAGERDATDEDRAPSAA